MATVEVLPHHLRLRHLHHHTVVLRHRHLHQEEVHLLRHRHRLPHRVPHHLLHHHQVEVQDGEAMDLEVTVQDGEDIGQEAGEAINQEEELVTVLEEEVCTFKVIPYLLLGIQY